MDTKQTGAQTLHITFMLGHPNSSIEGEDPASMPQVPQPGSSQALLVAQTTGNNLTSYQQHISGKGTGIASNHHLMGKAHIHMTILGHKCKPQ